MKRSHQLPDRPPGGLGRLVVPAAALLVLTACGFGIPDGATEQGRDISWLYRFMAWIAVGVGAVVYGLILWSVMRYRRRGDQLPRQFRDNVPLEILYTAIPVVLVVIIFVVTFRTEQRVDDLVDDPDVTIVVTGFQWQWRFEYPELGVEIVGSPSRQPEIAVPMHQNVRIELHAVDVVHSFYIPDFLFKRDAIPGEETSFDLVVEEPGPHYGECGEFCGLDHTDMIFWVEGLSAEDFDAWVQDQLREQEVA